VTSNDGFFTQKGIPVAESGGGAESPGPGPIELSDPDPDS